MTSLKLTSSSLSHSTKLMLQRSLMGAARRASTLTVAQAQRTVQASSSAGRPYSTQRFAKTKGQTSRLRRSGAPVPAETPAGVMDENIQDEPLLNKASASEPIAAPSPAATKRPVASMSPHLSASPQLDSEVAPPVRKPVDTSSKEYKEAASKYIRFVVAFPVFLVTSYFLWQRLQLQVTIRDSPAAATSSKTSRPTT